ncbi:PAS domain S-box protein [Mucilaginibacter conchicola]|uniref:histidine kinase n=1 Tax=Mucilaginibacter conchicola TaxID=2303333 RepID=A0A372NX45_9SPHI|nr:PAS domain-containing sensor histidine kinase [Mucilaginibacter conchicola]RFZ94602.1 PAS domain S-box protein [Mucilaginibacter conchicola]
MEPTESTFRDMVNLSPFPVYLCTGKDLVITVANNATLKAWSRDASVIGKPLAVALPELTGQPFLGYLLDVYHTGNPFHSDISRVDIDVEGSLQTYYYKFNYLPMRNSAGEIYGVAAFNTEVTELERAKQEVEESRMTLYNLVRQAPVGICIIRSADLVVDVVNESYLELVGKKRKQVEGKNIWDAIPEAKDFYAPVMDKVISTGVPFIAEEAELVLIRDGIAENVFVDFVYEPVRHFDGTINAIMVIAFEVTDKVLARRSIEDIEERNRLAIEAAEIGTFDFDMVKLTTVTSDRFNQIFGFDGPVPHRRLTDAIHPEDRSIRERAHDDALRSGYLYYEARIVRPDESVHWIRAQGKIYRDKDEKPVRMLGTILDITEFKRLQQQKDDFISVASHELKTPMTSVKASIQILDKLIKSGTQPDKISTFIDKANSSLNKMQHLVESLLNVSRISAGQLELSKSRFNVAEMVNESCDYVRLAGDHQVIIKGDKELEIVADKQKIEQILVNLVNNAVKYAPNSKDIIIEFTKRKTTVKITVQDFGEGIPYDKIPHLFERYYRVDSSGVQYSGLGLGLYISAEIVERHGGKIGVNSDTGRGSTFWFTLPLGD